MAVLRNGVLRCGCWRGRGTRRCGRYGGRGGGRGRRTFSCGRCCGSRCLSRCGRFGRCRRSALRGRLDRSRCADRCGCLDRSCCVVRRGRFGRSRCTVRRGCFGRSRCTVRRGLRRAGGILVLQSGNSILDSFRHGVYFALLGNVFAAHNSADSGFYRSEIFVFILFQSLCLGNRGIYFGVVGGQIRHCNSLRVRCRISCNCNIRTENFAIIGADLDRISTRFQINRVCCFLTVHFNDYIRQPGRCCNKRNRIFRCRQSRETIRIKPIIATRCIDFLTEILGFHIFKSLFCSSIRVLKASRDIFRFHKIIVFKNRGIRRNTACNAA